MQIKVQQTKMKLTQIFSFSAFKFVLELKMNKMSYDTRRVL